MSARCAVCKKAIVSKKGQLCVACQIGQNKITRNPKPEELNHMPEGKPAEVYQNITLTDSRVESKFGRISAGCYNGTVSNFQQTANKRSKTWKIWNSFSKGAYLSFSDVQYEFTLYEQGGVGCVSGHKVVMYGDAGYSLLSNGSMVTVRGKQDRNGVIVASEIMEVNTGFRMKPKNAVSPLVVRGCIFSLFILLFVLASIIIIWGVNVGGTVETARRVEEVPLEDVYSSDEDLSLLFRFLLAVIAGMGAILFMKSGVKKKLLYVLLCFLFMAGMFSQTFFFIFIFLTSGLVIEFLCRRF